MGMREFRTFCVYLFQDIVEFGVSTLSLSNLMIEKDGYLTTGLFKLYTSANPFLYTRTYFFISLLLWKSNLFI